MDLYRHVHDIPNFPKPGVIFKDITPLLKDPRALDEAVTQMADGYAGDEVELVVGAEARGFIFGPLVARKLDVGFVPIRKQGKLPGLTSSATYDLEYGADTLEIHQDAIEPGSRILVVDDLLATGGTMRACCNLIEELAGVVVGCSFFIELAFLPGRKKLANYTVKTVLKYDSE